MRCMFVKVPYVDCIEGVVVNTLVEVPVVEKAECIAVAAVFVEEAPELVDMQAAPFAAVEVVVQCSRLVAVAIQSHIQAAAAAAVNSLSVSRAQQHTDSLQDMHIAELIVGEHLNRPPVAEAAGLDE